MEKKTAKNYKYSGLGIDIIFKEVQLVKIANEWTPKVDVEKLSSKVFSLLTMKASLLQVTKLPLLELLLN